MIEESFYHNLIYIIEIPDAAHNGLLKIGETTLKKNCDIKNLTPNCSTLKKAALKRIKQYTNTAGINFNLLYTELAVYKMNGKLQSFSDHDVHRVLINSNVKKKSPPDSTGNEWFKVNLETAQLAIQAVKQGQKNLSGVVDDEKFIPIILRPEQEDAVSSTQKIFRKENKMLWNAKMRFGKTLTALELVRRIGFSKTIIITHRPVVDSSWYDDFMKVFNRNKNFIYGSKSTGYAQIDELLDSGKKFVYFASIQDLRGSEIIGGNLSKHEKIFSTDWDFVIVDEAHEGTTTILGDKVIKNIVKPNSKFLALSGTPFNILDSYEENVFTWDYVMEQRAKREWAEKNFGDSNPYEDLPQLKIFTYNLGKLLKNSAYVELQDKAFNFREFFRTDDDENFVHEDDVKSFLDLLINPKADNFPYSNERHRKIFRHSLWMIPGVKEGRALSKLLKTHKVFRYFKIVNVAGNGDADEESTDALEKVQKAIEENDYTITLSCGKLTVGVTVPEWTAVFMLTGSFSTSAASYMQTIFRVMSPCSMDGKFKQAGYVFDFAPDRTLKVIAESAAISAKAGKTDDNDRNILGEFLNFCPIVAFDGSKMQRYDANKLLMQLKRAYSERVAKNGFDDRFLYNDELLRLTDEEVEKFKILKQIIGASKSQKKSHDIEINAQGFTNEEYEKIKIAERKPAKQRTPEEIAVLEEIKRQNKLKATAISILRGISIRMPLLIYGANIPLDEDFKIEMFLDDNIVDPASWQEFMPKGVTKEIFKDFIKFYDPEVFIGAGHRIRNRAQNADKLKPTERVKEIAKIFDSFKNPDKETVLTPFRVVNIHLSAALGGWDFFDEHHENFLDSPRFVDTNVFTPNAKILEINSKTGLYPLYVAYSIYRARLGNRDENSLSLDELNEIWDETVSDNIFVICKTPMAQAVTKRTLGGFRAVDCNTHYFENLVDVLKFEPEKFVKLVKSKSLWKKGKGTMFFDAVVGNPPYQIANDSGNFAAPIYHDFLKTAFQLSDTVSLIHPARFLFNAGATPKDFNQKILNDPHFKVVKYFPDSREIFSSVDIKGGVAISLRDENKFFGPIVTFTAFDELNSIHKKVVLDNEKFQPLNVILNTQVAYRLSEKFFKECPQLICKLQKPNDNALRTNIFDRLQEIFFDNKPSDAEDYVQILGRFDERRAYKWIRRKFISDDNLMDKFKVFLPKANGTGEFGEILSMPLIGKPSVGATQTFISIGAFETLAEAEATLKYIKTKFVRALLGILKITQDHTPQTWSKVPLQNFTASSDIDWNKSIHEIDLQLYAKYNLTAAEINFIESKVQAMK